MRQPKFIPILMSTPMVVANLNGSKNQTRRLLVHGMDISKMHLVGFKDDQVYFKCDENRWWGTKKKYSVGDILWVRETTCYVMLDHAHDLLQGMDSQTVYKASVHSDWMEYAKEKYGYKWTPSLFMPKSSCRLFLQIVSVKVERLNDISEQDAINEGIRIIHMAEPTVPVYKNYLLKEELGTTNPIKSYLTLWESINGEGSWKDNPWVWVVKYKRIDKPENF